MDASIDTNILIHLYRTKHKELLFTSFDNIFVYKFIIEDELKNNAMDVYTQVKEDIINHRIQLIDNQYLASRGISGLFDENYVEYRILFGGDKGEAYAVAMATVLGIEAFVSNDTKDTGPHETLLKEMIEEIIPFAYYELLYLKYLKNDITCDEFETIFNEVTSIMSRPMSFTRRIKGVLRRYHPDRGTKRDIDWMVEFCKLNKIDMRLKVNELGQYIKNLEA